MQPPRHEVGHHVEPLPLPRPNSDGVRTKGLSRHEARRDRRVEALLARQAEAADSINSVALAGAGVLRAPETTQSGGSTLSQKQVLNHLWRRLELFPEDPVSRTDREALSALLKTVDLYAMDISTRASYDPAKLAILSGTAPPRELAD